MLRDVVSSVFLIAGALFCLVGSYGLLRFPDLLSRLQAATKPQTVGLLMLLFGAALQLDVVNAVGLVLVALIQVLTAPVLSQLVGRAGYRIGAIDPSTLVSDHLGERVRQVAGEHAADEEDRSRRARNRDRAQ